MAQEVGYFENDVEYTEGPFVIVYAEGWRIEVEMPGHRCPVLPDASVYPYVRAFGLKGKTRDRGLAARVCDLLNGLARHGGFELRGNCWVAAEAGQ